jgi:hypothetical protein
VEFESRFVETGDRPQRASIYRGWNSHRRELVRAGIPEASRQLLDGSYTTAKKSPGDMDIAVEVPLSHNGELAALTLDHPVVKLLLGPLMKQAYLCDDLPYLRIAQW